MTQIAAVVVTYNRCTLLMQCIEHIHGQKLPAGVSLDVLVVDNASTDDTLYSLTPFIEDGTVRYYNTGSNLGGAGGFAFGMRVAVEAGYDMLWVMDDDCLPSATALEQLLEASETVGEWGFLSSVVKWTDGSICAMNVQRHPLFNNIEDFSPAMQPASLSSFVSLLVPAQVVREVGLPHAEFFIWSDDWEFTRRISRRHPCYVVGTSQVVHASQTNNPGNIFTDPEERLGRYAYIYRNDVVLYREEGLRGHLYLWVRAIYHSLRVLLSDVDLKRERIDLIWKGTKEGFNFHPTTVFPEPADGAVNECNSN